MPGMAWLHSTVQRPDFVSPWSAAWNALLEAGIAQYGTATSKSWNLSTGTSRNPRHRDRIVAFSNDTEISIGDSEDPSLWTTCTLPHEALSNWLCKPWSLTFTHGEQAPLSELAVSSPPCQAHVHLAQATKSSTSEILQDDDLSLMQRETRSSGSQTREEVAEDFRRLQALVQQQPGAYPAAVTAAITSTAACPANDLEGNAAIQEVLRTPVVIPQALQNIRHYMHHNGINYQGDRPIQLVTWYLNHDRFRRCNRYRIVDLHRDPRRWARQIISKWRDLVLPDEAYFFLIVRPDPPGDPQPGQIPAHLILQQQPNAGERSILLTGQLPAHTPGMLWHWATVIQANSNKQALIRAAGAEPFCHPLHDDRRSQIWRGDRHYLHHEEIPIFAGDNILLVVNTLQISDSIPRHAGDEQDAVFLMQQHQPLANKLHKTWLHTVSGIISQPVDTQCELIELHPTLQTWYLDHDTIRHCFEPRTWTPIDDPRTWESQLRQLWYDTIDPQQNLQIVVVNHDPFRHHLLITQGSNKYRGVLLHSPPSAGFQDRAINIAVSTFRQITGEQIIRHLGMSMHCQDHPCTVHVGVQHIDEHAVLPVETGDVVIVRQYPHMRSFEHDVDQISLMARSVVPSPPANIEDDALAAVHLQAAEEPESSEGHLTDDAVELPTNAVWHAVVLFRVGLASTQCRLRSDDLEIRHRQAAYYLRLTRHQLLRLHPTRSVPRDLLHTEWPLLAQVIGDIQPGATTKLVLIDTEFHNHPPSLEPETVRQCKAIPQRMTRHFILSFLGLVPYCRHNGHCMLWVNNQLVGSDDQKLLLLEHGDYIRIAVPPSKDSREISTRTAALCHHHDLGPIDYPRVAAAMPEHMDFDQMPTQEGHISSVWFNDDLPSFVQLKLRTSQALQQVHSDTYAHIREHHVDHRLEDDPTHAIRQCIAQNAQRDQEARQANRAIGAWILPPGLRDLHEHLISILGAVAEHETDQVILTWYLNHRTAWRCNIARPVALPAQITGWAEAILSTWRDEVDHAMPVMYHLVQPRPYDLEHGITAHLIVVQPELFDVAAVLLSVYNHAVRQGQVNRFAVLHGLRLSHADLFDHAGCEELCRQPDVRCTAWYGWDEIHWQEVIDVTSGAGITLSIHREQPMPEALLAVDQLEFHDAHEHLSLVQTHYLQRATSSHDDTVRPEHDISLSQSARNSTCHDTAPEGDSEEGDLIPGQVTIDQMPNWVQSLWPTVQAAQAAISEACDKSVYIQTWYLNHLTQLRCEEGRPLRLTCDYTTWHQQAKHLWEDVLDQDHSCLFGIVQPQPLQVGSIPFVAHLIISQHRDNEVLLADQKVEIVSTLIFEHEVHSQMHQNALIMPAWSLADDIFYVLRVHNTCLQRRSVGVTCFIQHGPNVMELGLRDLLRPGDSIIVHIPPAPQTPTAVSLLQKHVIIRTTPTDTGHGPEDGTGSSDLPFQVCLAEAVHAPVWTKVDFSRVCFLRNCLREPRFPFGSYALDEVPWKECSKMLLDGLLPWNGEVPTRLHFYTDGSADNLHENAASAVFLCVESEQGWHFGGFHAFQPIKSRTAQSAEHSAILGAILWGIDIIHQHCCKPTIVVHFDCLAAGNAASGKWNAPAAATAPVTRALVMWIEELTQQIAWCHTPAHANNPGNEAADVISRQAWQKKSFTCEIHTLWNMCTFDEKHTWVCEWLWYLERINWQPHLMPQLHDQMLWFNVRAPFESTPTPAFQAFLQRRPEVTQTVNLTACIRAATANVLTLFPGDHGSGRFLSARTESLLCQFAEANIDIVGMQETRLRQGGYRKSNGFHILSAAATEQGHYGVSLCIRDSLKADGKKIKITCKDLHIVASSPRHLIVKMQHQDLKLLMIVAHVPIDDHQEGAQRFWDVVSGEIPQSCHRWSTIALIDANAKVGSIPTKSIGSHQADEQNPNGLALHKWLQANDMFLPQTFEQHHSGEAPTWTHANGSTARIDYIALSMNLATPDVATVVDESIDIQVTREDHKCVVATFQIACTSSHHRNRKQTADVQHTVTPHPTWNTNVHDHAALLQQQVWQTHQEIRQAGKQKHHLSDDTWALIQTKKWHYRHALYYERTWKHGMLRVIFQTWCEATTPDDNMCTWISKCAQMSVWHRFKTQELTQHVKQACRQDDATFYEHLATQTAKRIQDTPGEIWDAVRPLLPKTRRKHATSLRCTGPSVEDRCEYYSHLEAGSFHTFEHALEVCHQQQMDLVHDAPLQTNLANLPSRLVLETLCNNVRTGRACGLDGIGPEVWKHKNVEVAESLCHLMTKIWLTSAEPFQFKGGRLHSIAKRHGSNQVEDLRGIMILDGIGKLFHAFLRKKFLETASRWRQPMQLGGYPRQQTLFGTHYIRSLMQCCSAKTMSCSILFLDLKSAFHTLLREQLMGHTRTLPLDLVRVLQQGGFDIGVLEQEIEHHSDWFQVDVPTDVQRALQDAHVATWFLIEGEPKICTTTRGSRPGSPLADLAFNAFISHLIWEVQDRINVLPSMQSAHVKLQTTTPILSWVDDLAVPMVTTKPQEMPTLIQDVTGIVYDACHRRGLTLNFRPGKTEVICRLKGAGSTELKQSLFVEHLGHLPLTNPPVTLRLVGDYEHLGTRCSQSGSITHEVNTRIGKASSAHRTVSKSILHNRRISPMARVRLFEALIIPVLLHGAGNWPILNRRTFVKLQHVIISWIRAITNDGHWNSHQTNDTDFLAKWGVLDLKSRLNKCRLLYGFQMFQNAPSPLIEFVTAVDQSAPNEWLGAIREAIQWVASLDETLRQCTGPDMHAEQILQWFHHHQHHGPAKVRRCAVRHSHLERQMHTVRSLHQDLCSIAQTKGVVFQTVMPPREVDAVDFPCPECTSVFKHPQHLAAHRWSKHGNFSDERRFCFDAVCRACQTCFWSIQRLQQHLKASRRFPDGCYCQLTWWCKPLAQPSHVDKPASLKAFHRLPACPTMMTPAHPQRIASHEDAQQVFHHEWERLDLPDQLLAEDQHACFQTIESFMHTLDTYAQDEGQTHLVPLLFALQNTSLVGLSEDLPIWALSVWVKSHLHPSATPSLDEVSFARLREDLWALIQEFPLGRMLLWKWRMEEAYIPDMSVVQHSDDRSPPEQVRCSYLRQHDMIASIIGTSRPTIPDCQGVPVVYYQGQACLFILHLFSGRRRNGDCHDWIHELAPRTLPGFRVILLSMDTAIHPHLGNLDEGEALAIAKKMTMAGLVSGILTGPPCETWSAARSLPPPPDAHVRWPRPIRDRDHPWGKPTNTPRENRQVDMGTKLLLHSWQLELGTVLNGGGSLKEHPTQPDDETKASTWATTTHQLLMMSLPGAHLHRIQQWRYGSKAVKPTCLRALNLGSPEIASRILCETELFEPAKPVMSLQGKDESGSFRTSAAKEYPRHLCKAIVATLLGGLSQRLQAEGARICTDRLPPEMDSWISGLSQAAVTIRRSQFLPDYQGS